MKLHKLLRMEKLCWRFAKVSRKTGYIIFTVMPIYAKLDFSSNLRMHLCEQKSILIVMARYDSKA